MDVTTRTALVLGGGGVAGIAWTTGVLTGLAKAGADVTGADFLLGTSAGSAVAAQLGSGLPLGELYGRQADPALQNKELRPDISVPDTMGTWVRLYIEVPDPEERRRRVCALALEAETVPEAERRAVIEDRLPAHTWPERPLAIVAVDARSGEPRIFDRGSGVGLVDAVAASCAVPMVWPPVTIGGTRYVDGGVRSGANADLAAGYDRILIIAPLPFPEMEGEIALLSRKSRVELITPDEASLAAIGPDPLDPDTRTPSAQAGLDQGRTAAAVVSELWPTA
jgi:NTE family protein